MVTRRKQKKDPLLSLIGMIALGAWLFTYTKTNSLITSSIIAGCILGVSISILIIINRMKIEKLKSSGIFEVDNMTGREFEIYLSHLFRSHGYDVQLTEATGDYGADLILKNINKKIIVQAKRYNSNVGIKAVQEAQAAIAHYNGDEAWVITNSYFTNAASSLAKSNGVQLMNREALIKLMLEVNSKADLDAFNEELDEPVIIDEPNECPRCGNELVLRSSSSGDFLGCSSFPKCRHTQSL